MSAEFDLQRQPSQSGDPTVPRASTARTFDEVVAQMRVLLASGAVKPGDRLPAERELSIRLGVGRPALREALRWLEGAGLIEMRKGKTGGAFISAGRPSVVSQNLSDLLRLGNVSIPELFEARAWIQSEMVRVVCDRITEPQLRALEESIRQAERFDALGQPQKRTETNIEFHNLLAQASRNPVMVVVVRGLTDALLYLVRQVGSGLPRSHFTVRYRLVRALRRGDKDAAVAAMKRIVSDAEAMYVRLAVASKTPAAALATRRAWMGDGRGSDGRPRAAKSAAPRRTGARNSSKAKRR